MPIESPREQNYQPIHTTQKKVKDSREYTRQGKTNQLQNTQNSVNVPPLIGRKALRRQTNLRRQSKFELVVRDLEECQQFSDKDTDILLVDQGVGQFECATPDGDISVS